MIATPKVTASFLSCFFFFWILALKAPAADKSLELLSPDKRIKVVVEVEGDVTYAVFCDGQELVLPFPCASRGKRKSFSEGRRAS